MNFSFRLFSALKAENLLSGVPAASLLWFAPGFGAGCALAFTTGTENKIYFIAGLISLIAFLFIRKSTATVSFLSLRLAIGLLCGMFVGLLNTANVQPFPAERALYSTTVQGEIKEIVRKEYKSAFIVSVKKLTDRNGNSIDFKQINLNVPNKKDADRFLPGDMIRVKAHLFRPPGALFAGDYDYSFFAQAQGISATGKITDAPVKIGERETFSRSIEKIRNEIKHRVYVAVDPVSAGILTALLTGDRSGVSSEIAESWKISGIYHLISISGLHMTIVAGFGYFLFGKLIYLFPFIAKRVNTRKISAVFCLALTGFYTALAGFDAPVSRAFVMTAVIFIGILIDRKSLNIHGLCAAYMIVLLFSPEQIFDIGFNLSFSAVIGIFVALRFIQFLFYRNLEQPKNTLPLGKIIRRISEFMIVNLFAGYAGAPLAVYAFNHTGIYSFAANLIAIPLSSFMIMPALALGAVTLPFDFSRYFFEFAALFLTPLNETARFFATAPGASVPLPSPSVISLILFYAGLYLAVILRKNAFAIGLFCVFTSGALYAFEEFPKKLLLSEGNIQVIRENDQKIVIMKGNHSKFYLSSYMRERIQIKLGARKDAVFEIKQKN